MLKASRIFLAATLSLLLAGCSSEESAKSSTIGHDATSDAQEPVQVAAAQVDEANELGMVPILEYHGVAAKESRWVRSVPNFRKDLEYLAANGYVTATLVDMLEGFPNVPAGKKPVVMTFDDARGDQFVAAGIDPEGLAIPSADCGVGIMTAFAESHPEFGRKASFYLLPGFFDEAKTADAKLKYLAKNGFELGNHTWSHLMLGKAQPDKIRGELERLQGAIRKVLGPDFRTRTLALPNGSVPKSLAQREAAVGGKGAAYHHEAMLLVGANPAHSPFSREYDPLRLARIQALDEEFKHWFGRSPGQTTVSRETFTPYVSDGNPKSVSFPRKAEAHLGKDRLRGAMPRVISEAGKVAAAPATAETLQPEAAKPADVTQATSDAPLPQADAENAPVAAEPADQAIGASGSANAGLAMHPGYNQALPDGGFFKAGKIFHTVQKGQALEKLLNRYLAFTDAYTSRELRDQVAKTNGLKRPWVNPGQTIEIPGVRPQPPRPVSNGAPADFEVKGIYCTSTTASFERIFTLAKAVKAVGGNSVVFDIKDGPIAILSKDPKVREMSEWDHTVNDLPKLVDRLHKMGMHVIARQVLFNDPVLARKRPDLAIHSKRNPNKVWLQKGRTPWVDPSQPEVQDYNLRLAREIAASGVDEIQFDYVRFPAEGEITDNKFTFDEAVTPKHTIITGFLKRAREELRPYKCLIAIDIFGVIAWNATIDEKNTGQRIQDMAKYVDVVCPMVYPSHFYPPFDGFSRPANQPYYFIAQGVERTRRKLGPNVTIRPWLQAFPYMVANYNPDYVLKQIQGNRDAKGNGWLLWNASNKYDIALRGVDRWNQVAAKTPAQAVHVKLTDDELAKIRKAAKLAGVQAAGASGSVGTKN